MAVKKRKSPERPVFDAIRKPIAPPSQKFGGAKSEVKARPSQRKFKHKKRNDLEIADADL